MKFSEAWLRKWVNPTVTTDDLIHRLTMSGLEVESKEPVCKGFFEGVVVGEIKEINNNSKNSKLCKVDIGEELISVNVDGDVSLNVGDKVAIETENAKTPRFPEGIQLAGNAKGRIAIVNDYLESPNDVKNFWLLPPDAPVGKDIYHWLEMHDHSIDINVTPNRGDCLSIAGLAREVAALYEAPLTIPPITTITSTSAATLKIAVADPADCANYVGRVIKHINPHAITPLEITERLRRSGINVIHPVVDVANYVMLELGQPLHAFDLQKLSGSLSVRRAQPKEIITLLDGRKVLLNTDTLVIADQNKVQAIAGIMGGQESAVSDKTQDIFIESAYFNPLTIAGRARKYNLSTDASHRFERGIDPTLQRRACERMTELLLEITGGQVGPIVESRSDDHIPKVSPILLRMHRIEKVLGIDISTYVVEEILSRLGMELTKEAQGWLVTPPAFRFDIAIEEDLIEEIGRVYEFEKIPPKALSTHLHLPLLSEQALNKNRILKLMVDKDYHEVITYSFVDPAIQKLVDPHSEKLILANPISSELAEMRTSLWPGLLSAVQYNLNRQQNRIRLFELGRCYRVQKNDLHQSFFIGGAAVGNAYPEQWGVNARLVDFFDVKADVEALIYFSGIISEIHFVAAEHPALHPGQSCKIVLKDKEVGWLGGLHPLIAKKLEIQNAFLFELEWDAISQAKLPIFKPLSKFPGIRRDIAFTVNENISAAHLQKCIAEAAGDWLINIQFFDLYKGKGVAEGQKSMAIGLVWQHPDRTLTETDINFVMNNVIKALQQKFAVILRL